MSASSMMDPEAAKAAEEALLQFVTEDWTLFSIGLVATITRTFARVRQVGFKGLQGDDYLVWLGMVFYAAETSLAYAVGAAAKGLANNGMTDEQRIALDPSSSEYHLRVVGCRIQLAGWSTYSALLWTLKASLLFFYIRLTAGLGGTVRIRIYVGFGFLISTYLAATLNLFLGCRPFHKYWQINPDPGNDCQPAISTRIVWVYAILNVVTDLYLLSIPIPMLWQSSLKLPKKIGLIILFSGGVFVIVCAFLRAALIVTDPVNGAQVAGSWAVRETFVAVLTTNIPMIFPLVHMVITPLFSSIKRSIRSSSYDRSTDGNFRSIVTFGGGGGSGQNKRGPRTANPITEFTFSDSEERMLNQGQVKLQDLSTTKQNGTATLDNVGDGNVDGIRRDVEVAVTSVPSSKQRESQGNYAFASGPKGKGHDTHTSN
ncbi:hypothetical protein F5Y19DRAFT_429732 [Xylariaceae sp. FL1651]|nr:hypothetical protein F5Y19DRAFT_429732 [Xylariaceae sp. FL1651]